MHLLHLFHDGRTSMANRRWLFFPPAPTPVSKKRLVLVKSKKLQEHLLVLVTTSQDTGTTGGNETDLLTRRGVTSGGGRVTDVLMVTTTVGMLNRVHRHTSNLRPAVSLHTVLVERGTGLQHRLIDTTTAGNDADNGTGTGVDTLTSSGRQLDHGLLSIFGVTDDNAGRTGGTGDSATIGEFVFDHGDDGSLRALSNRKDVSDGQLGGFTTVDELPGVGSFDCNHQLLINLVSVRIAEVHSGQRCATSRVVDDLLDETLDIAVTFGVVEATELGGSLTMLGLSGEDASSTLSLTADDTTHFGVFFVFWPLPKNLKTES